VGNGTETVVACWEGVEEGKERSFSGGEDDASEENDEGRGRALEDEGKFWMTRYRLVLVWFAA
jgi:hypothetical protein